MDDTFKPEARQGLSCLARFPDPLCRSSRRHRPFTLVELLVVMVIMAILLGIAIAPFEKLATGTGVDAAARTVSSQLRLARQYAISNRTRVAVALPADQGPQEDRKYTALRTFHEDSSGNWQPVKNTQWEYLPTGAVIDPVEPAPAHTETINGDTYRAVVFKPTGALDHAGDITVTVYEGVFTDGTLVSRNQSNKKEIVIDQYTGRVHINGP